MRKLQSQNLVALIPGHPVYILFIRSTEILIFNKCTARGSNQRLLDVRGSAEMGTSILLDDFKICFKA